MSGLPQPVTTDQRLLAALCERLDRQNILLGEIRDRLPEAGGPGGGPVGDSPGGVDGGGVVLVSEPAPPPAPAKTRKAGRPSSRRTVRET